MSLHTTSGAAPLSGKSPKSRGSDPGYIDPRMATFGQPLKRHSIEATGEGEASAESSQSAPQRKLSRKESWGENSLAASLPAVDVEKSDPASEPSGSTPLAKSSSSRRKPPKERAPACKDIRLKKKSRDQGLGLILSMTKVTMGSS